MSPTENSRPKRLWTFWHSSIWACKLEGILETRPCVMAWNNASIQISGHFIFCLWLSENAGRIFLRKVDGRYRLTAWCQFRRRLYNSVYLTTAFPAYWFTYISTFFFHNSTFLLTFPFYGPTIADSPDFCLRSIIRRKVDVSYLKTWHHDWCWRCLLQSLRDSFRMLH